MNHLDYPRAARTVYLGSRHNTDTTALGRGATRTEGLTDMEVELPCG
ncbi:hypothetical protein SBD_1755 [Streptomyces bottropensis ATCC 25435]|uniref:Uncharacterized protein n=1 Tax=Streptomyces bottropensis ATCC 25435 TaxID=1054862 RepID=M3FXE7_9ACTN|nr:hypothetical protein SBD_1755 [Streptomyces bottropensis ATCC 25435]